MVRRTRTRKVINAIGFCIFVPFGLVWISGEALYELAKDESKVQKKLYQEKKKYRTRKSLAPPEPSKLKVSLPSIFGKQEQPVEFDTVDPQFQSRLLSLPGEIRDLIYHRSCIPNVYNRASAYEDPDRVQRLGMFAHCTGGMIRACRSIYLEASDYLYSTNMFCLNTLDMLIHLRNSISPRHFGLIKHLQITHQVTHFEQFVSERKNSRKIPLYPPYDNKTWKEVWRIISEEMHGLKDLRVRAFGENISIRTTRVWRLCMLEEMRKVRGLDHFSFDSDNLFMKRGNLDYAEWEEDVITAKEQLKTEVMMPRDTMKIEYKEKIIEIER
ncbi:hypothetical protein TWF225_003265 [Orbilia oligospora]|uniref:DUF7730 domain-containing protein n=1 Tax=Orbilia oligospora TaxID=2813651 RepID=A0A8H2HRF7_ORBOL|nr:hypothetical protein TWF225_003265 [Orbilia oligospora]TGJ69211.1 hypothetical protein EYR41_005267 [Orbilia oligospora]